MSNEALACISVCFEFIINIITEDTKWYSWIVFLILCFCVWNFSKLIYKVLKLVGIIKDIDDER